MGRHELPPEPEPLPGADTYFDEVFGYYTQGRQGSTQVLHIARTHDHLTGMGIGAVIFALHPSYPGEPQPVFFDMVISRGYFDEGVRIVAEAQPVSWIEELPGGMVAVGCPPEYWLDGEPVFFIFHAPAEPLPAMPNEIEYPTAPTDLY